LTSRALKRQEAGGSNVTVKISTEAEQMLALSLRAEAVRKEMEALASRLGHLSQEYFILKHAMLAVLNSNKEVAQC
jgi:hypothetical protein